LPEEFSTETPPHSLRMGQQTHCSMQNGSVALIHDRTLAKQDYPPYEHESPRLQAGGFRVQATGCSLPADLKAGSAGATPADNGD
jgi:hypothetical protein